MCRIQQVISSSNADINGADQESKSSPENVSDNPLNTVNSVNQPLLNNSYNGTEFEYVVNRR